MKIYLKNPGNYSKMIRDSINYNNKNLLNNILGIYVSELS